MYNKEPHMRLLECSVLPDFVMLVALVTVSNR